MYEYLKAFVALADKWVPHWKQSEEFKKVVVEVKENMDNEQKLKMLVKKVCGLENESAAVNGLIENMKEEYNEK